MTISKQRQQELAKIALARFKAKQAQKQEQEQAQDLPRAEPMGAEAYPTDPLPHLWLDGEVTPYHVTPINAPKSSAPKPVKSPPELPE